MCHEFCQVSSAVGGGSSRYWFCSRESTWGQVVKLLLRVGKTPRCE